MFHTHIHWLLNRVDGWGSLIRLSIRLSIRYWIISCTHDFFQTANNPSQVKQLCFLLGYQFHEHEGYLPTLTHRLLDYWVTAPYTCVEKRPFTYMHLRPRNSIVLVNLFITQAKAEYWKSSALRSYSSVVNWVDNRLWWHLFIHHPGVVSMSDFTHLLLRDIVCNV